MNRQPLARESKDVQQSSSRTVFHRHVRRISRRIGVIAGYV